MSRIISIGTAVPRHNTEQNEILAFMHAAYDDETASRKLNVLFHHSGISTRYSAIPDFDMVKPGHFLFNGNRTIPGVTERLTVFKDNAVSLAINAIQDTVAKLRITVAEAGITHLITVTCTGMYAPGLDAELIEQLNLPSDIYHTSVNFLGCNAAFHALKIGDMIAQTDENAKVLIVCVELCTLHFQPKNNTDNLLSNTIFGDGAAALIITSDKYSDRNHLPGLSIKGFYSVLLSEGKDLMGWNVTPVNFEMVLDTRVPEFIGEELGGIIVNARRKLMFETIHKWVVHPGGKKILDTIKKQLQLDDHDLGNSYKILNEYGNMSSPTILFVLDEVVRHKPGPHENIFAVGFGPGLSIETALLAYVG
jgi:predicted naringenin-chalcone synthase